MRAIIGLRVVIILAGVVDTIPPGNVGGLSRPVNGRRAKGKGMSVRGRNVQGHDLLGERE